ncbi:UDP-N-acetylmuramate--L-alanine ligase [Candidatus Sneabacter namystus]|uniref:UDP-N-acetylmuramate--L-alanine ligase n=1 Tax=Candidatus Sneabacter namystus TaxID=2601646 RepID=A0A5C0UIF0_9RICK|nr:UDP-N-acetylmuramate--L-alanine ligase [Candidatus Sneabacter namystus]QEK39557.1 UDP-N-acetylmuramate--L-alanine ligase [Candidatus Sneabacter namystus]
MTFCVDKRFFTIFSSSVHFVGIGGAGMSGIAKVLVESNVTVTGSDIGNGKFVQQLKALGVRVFSQHDASNVEHASCVVFSSAISKDNPEIVYARKMDIPVLHRSEILSLIARLNFCFAVSGSHGKTITTTILAQALEYSGISPTVINGGVMMSGNTNAYIGKDNVCVVEGDESDGSFLKLKPDIAIITNIDKDHLSNYDGSFYNIQKAFFQFMSNIPKYGFVVACGDDMCTRSLINMSLENNNMVISYGIKSSDLDVKAINIRYNDGSTTFDVAISQGSKYVNFSPEEFARSYVKSHSQSRNMHNLEVTSDSGCYVIKDISFNAFGDFNVLNCLAVLSVFLGLRIPFDKNVFQKYAGVARRCNIVGNYQGSLVIDDYAHHPTEIAAVLRAIKSGLDVDRVIVVIEPHRKTRLKALLNDFVDVLSGVSAVYVTSVFDAWEEVDEDITSMHLVDKLDNCKYVQSVAQLKKELDMNFAEIPHSVSRSSIVFMGAGNSSSWAHSLVDLS